jgi:hypothetical protein
MTTPDHEAMRALLPDLAEGGLEAGRRDTVETHLAACPACRDELDALVETLGLLQGLPSVAAPPDLSAKVRSRIRRRSSPRRRQAPVEQRIETTSAATVLVAAFLLIGARLLVPMPEALDASGPVETAAVENGVPVLELRVPASQPGAVRRLLATAAEVGAVDAAGRPIEVPATRDPLRPWVHELFVPAEAVPRLLPEGAARMPAPPVDASGRVRVRVVVD